MEDYDVGRETKSDRVCFVHNVPVWLEALLDGEQGVVGLFDYS